MAEFDPMKLLRNMRAKTPTKNAPEPPPRPQEDATEGRLASLEGAVMQLQQQLKSAQLRERGLEEENATLKQMLSQAEDARAALEANFKVRLESLDEELAQTKELNRDLLRKLESPQDVPRLPPKPEAKLRLEVKKPAFSPAVATNSARFAPSKQSGKLDLAPLMELYKIMPDFPRPVLHIDFSDKMAQYVRLDCV